MSVVCRFLADTKETLALGRELSRGFVEGDIVLLEGELGVGKTTLVRGILDGLGFHDTVRSPTYNLIQTFETVPPVMHADLYRVDSFAGIGIEDYLDSHLCLIEWPERVRGLIDPIRCWRIAMSFDGDGRRVQIEEPEAR